MSACLSFCPSVKMVQLVFRLDRFSETLIFEDFSKIVLENSVYVKSGNDNEYFTLRLIYSDGNVWLNFMTVSCSILLRTRYVSETCSREITNTHFMFHEFFSKNYIKC